MEEGEDCPVRVLVRIRPEFEGPNDEVVGKSCIATLDHSTLKIMPPDGVFGTRKSVSAMDDKIYTYDRIFPHTCSQEDIYECVCDHVLQTIRGYNTTIFAYGATGSGKSYTMTGNKAAPVR